MSEPQKEDSWLFLWEWRLHCEWSCILKRMCQSSEELQEDSRGAKEWDCRYKWPEWSFSAGWLGSRLEIVRSSVIQKGLKVDSPFHHIGRTQLRLFRHLAGTPPVPLARSSGHISLGGVPGHAGATGYLNMAVKGVWSQAVYVQMMLIQPMEETSDQIDVISKLPC